MALVSPTAVAAATIRHGGRHLGGQSFARLSDTWRLAWRLLLLPAMASLDRAFRALARELPQWVVALLEHIAPQLLGSARGATVQPEHVDDPHLDPPPALEADWVARLGDDELLHVECQGYRDSGFVDRLFRYHLALLLRYPQRKVRTVALWVVRPAAHQLVDHIVRRGVRVDVTSVLLPEVPARLLLGDRRTACFAAGADPGTLTDEQLCSRVARALVEGRAGLRAQCLAVALAATQGRYDAMLKAMQQADLEPIFIEDLIHIGEDRGLAKGEAKGRQEGEARAKAEAVVAVLRARGVELTADAEHRVSTCRDVEQLDHWLRQAATAAAAGELEGLLG